MALGVGLKVDVFGLLINGVAHRGIDDLPVEGEYSHVVKEDDAQCDDDQRNEAPGSSAILRLILVPEELGSAEKVYLL